MNTKYEIDLQAGLSAENQAKAYQIMGLVLIDYRTDHTVSKAVSNALNKAFLLEYSRPVQVMYHEQDYQSVFDIEATDFHNACGDR